MSGIKRSIEDFLSLWASNTERTYRTTLKQWMEFLSNDEQRFIWANGMDAVRFTAELKNRTGRPERGSDKRKKLSHATVAVRIDALKSLYDYLVKVKLIEENPFTICAEILPRKKSQRRPTEMVPFEDVMRLCDAPSPITKKGVRDRGMFACFFGAALRRNEALTLRMQDVTIEEDGNVYLRLRGTKNGRDEDQVLVWGSDRVKILYDQRIAEGASRFDFLFVRYNRKCVPVGRMSESTFYRTFVRWCNEIGLPDVFSPHSARATVLSKMFSDQVDNRTVQRFGRHASITTTERYDKRHINLKNRSDLRVKWGK